MKQKTYFASSKALVSATPMWAKWIFRGYILLAPAISGVVEADPAISELTKKRVNIYLLYFTPVVLGFSKLFGVEPADDENEPGKE